MGRPHPVLFDIARNQPPRPFAEEEAAGVVDSALEHRMGGLLWSRVGDGTVALPRDETQRLAKVDLSVRAHHARLWRVLDFIQRRLAEIGVDAAVAKGVAAEARWYDRIGDRPSRDIDLVLGPSGIQRVGEVVARLDDSAPRHDAMSELARRGILQSVDLRVDRVPVDLHVDVMKIEVPTRTRDWLWERTRTYPGPGGMAYRALDAETSLIHFLLHLTKDRFARLIGYVDVSRILARERLDWDFIEEWATREGLRVPVASALYRVTSALELPDPPMPRPAGWRAAAWSRLWPEPSTLLGNLGAATHEHRRFWIPWLAEGRRREAARWMLRRRVFPPDELVSAYYPEERGPYVVRLVTGRAKRALQRRGEARRYRRSGARPR